MYHTKRIEGGFLGAKRCQKSDDISHLPIPGGSVSFPVLMNLTDFLILAQAAAPAPAAPPQSPWISMLPLVFVFIIFYFLLIRPQQKRQKEHAALVAAIKTGDHIVTNGGIHGIVSNVKEKTVMVKVADNVKMEFDRAAVTAVEKSPETSS